MIQYILSNRETFPLLSNASDVSDEINDSWKILLNDDKTSGEINCLDNKVMNDFISLF